MLLYGLLCFLIAFDISRIALFDVNIDNSKLCLESRSLIRRGKSFIKKVQLDSCPNHESRMFDSAGMPVNSCFSRRHGSSMTSCFDFVLLYLRQYSCSLVVGQMI